MFRVVFETKPESRSRKQKAMTESAVSFQTEAAAPRGKPPIGSDGSLSPSEPAPVEPCDSPNGWKGTLRLSADSSGE